MILQMCQYTAWNLGEQKTMRADSPTLRRRKSERGFVLITMTAAAIAIFLAVGMAVDIGRMFIVKNETQNFCDAAALAAALSLDGTSTGITNAQNAVTNSTNTWNFGTSTISSPTVEFATTSNGPWSGSPSSPSGILYVRVKATAPVPMYFIPVVNQIFTQNVNSYAIGGQIPYGSFKQGLAPYTAVSTNTTGPNFGLTVGENYDIQWPQFNGSRGNCPSVPTDCFNPSSKPCSGDLNSPNTLAAVAANWGSANNGYWGASSNSDIQNEILDVIQLTPISVGTNITPVLTNGNKAAEAVYLDDRASEDTNYTDNTVGINPASGYLADPHNGRRLLAVPIVDPISPTETDVVGYGQFLLYTNGSPSNYYQKTNNGNDPFCAIYAGPFDIGSFTTGAGGTNGATVVRLVQ